NAQRNPDPIGVRGNRWGEMHTFVYISGNRRMQSLTIIPDFNVFEDDGVGLARGMNLWSMRKAKGLVSHHQLKVICRLCRSTTDLASQEKDRDVFGKDQEVFLLQLTRMMSQPISEIAVEPVPAR
ncbi:MAG: hypothetical protein JXB07_20740, partial [Anaerolineae bacterium]|nr:hypothetical protein [Anaerolineae bacterium]